MAFRFQKRVKIAPGVRLNISKGGVSTSIGPRGATLNIGKKGIRQTVGIPGTGLSWSREVGWKTSDHLRPSSEIEALAKAVDDQAAAFDRLSEKADRSIAAWNNARSVFEGGRGPNASKYQTLGKRFRKFQQDLEKSQEETENQLEFLGAVSDRANGLRFGFFSGNSKRLREEVLRGVERNKKSFSRFIALTSRAIGDAEEQYISANPMVDHPETQLKAEPNLGSDSCGGYIGGFGLSEWWLSTFSPSEQEAISKQFNAYRLSTSNDLELASGPLMHTAEGVVHFLNGLVGGRKENQRTIDYRIIEKAEQILAPNSDVLDRHFLYMSKVKAYYRWRNIDDFALEKAIEACRQQIEVSSEAAKSFKNSWGDIPSHYGFKQLAIIEEKRGNYDEAILLCEKAMAQGWNGDWQKRLERLRKKQKKVS